MLAHLPAEILPVIEFAHITGWRIASEVYPLEWRQVDFAAGEIRLDAGTIKNEEGRVFSMTLALRRLLEAQDTRGFDYRRSAISSRWCSSARWPRDAVVRRNRKRS